MRFASKRLIMIIRKFRNGRFRLVSSIFKTIIDSGSASSHLPHRGDVIADMYYAKYDIC